jgi:hypothetical protein
VLLLLVLATASACDDFPEVAVENRSGRSVDVQAVGISLPADDGETIVILTGEDDWPDTVEAYGEDGTLVFRRLYTWEELEALDFKIVIE